MTPKTEWLRVRELTRKQFRATGGCFWDLDPSSPGHSLRIPSGTPFHIHLEGSGSLKLVHGVCRDGAFVVNEPHGETSHPSANRAVHQTRKGYAKRTNAYLYIAFKIDGRFILADELRQSSTLGIPRIDAYALDFAKDLVRKKHPKLKAADVLARAETLCDTHPEVVERAREMMQADQRFSAELSAQLGARGTTSGST